MTTATASHPTWVNPPADVYRSRVADGYGEARRSPPGGTVVALHALGGGPPANGAADIGAEVISIDVAAQVCSCQPQRIVERLRVGDLPGVKFGHGWTIPRLAFIQRLNELALAEAAARRLEAGKREPGMTHAPAAPPLKQGRPRSVGV